ncbi:MAG TPA: ABC transporter substrate-binding protein [Candidatus Contendobacter sp.]|nr:ABC transporter substrate-binding protein [Candidatus Contendobacter sp.]
MVKRLFGIVFLAVFLIACGESQQPERARVKEPEKAVKTEPAPKEQKTPAPESANIMRAFYDWPAWIDPAIGNSLSSSVALVNIYDSLVFPNAKGGVDPWLAESWTTSADGLKWTFKLRKDLRFHTGKALGASDVVYSLNRIKLIKKGFAPLYANVTGARAVDESTVEFSLEKPSALFLPSLIRLYILNEELVTQHTASAGDYGVHGDYGANWLKTNSAGSGPYRVLEMATDEYILLEKNTGWWGKFVADAPSLFRMMAVPSPPEIAGQMLLNGQTEFGHHLETLENLDAQAKAIGIQIGLMPTLKSLYFAVHNRKAPTDDIHFRQAMAYAIDYDGLLALTWPGIKQMHGPVPAALFGHDPEVFTYRRDMQKAREALSKSRYAGELDRYTVEIYWVSEAAFEERFALLFKANMAELGITVQPVKVAWKDAIKATASMDTSPHILIVYVGADIPEAGQMLYQRYHSNTTGSWMQNEWLLDPDLDKTIEDALTTIDTRQRLEKYHALQRQIAERTPSFFIYDLVHPMPYRADYVDWPMVRGEMSPVTGYFHYAARIGVRKNLDPAGSSRSTQ